MFLGNLSKDSVASSLLNTINNTNHNVHKKTTTSNSSTQQKTGDSSNKKDSLWDYSDVFGQEWEQGLGTAHRVLAEDKPTTYMKSFPQLMQGKKGNEQQSEKPTRICVPKKVCPSTNSLKKPHSSPNKINYSTERVSQKPSFKEELEAWRLRNSSWIPSESKASKSSVKRRCNDSSCNRNVKSKVNKEELYWSDEDEDSEKEVYSFEDLMKEEERSARIAAKEDAEEYRKEQERKRKKKLQRLKHKFR